MATQDNELTRPSHYGGEENPFEPIKIIEHYDLDFCLGNVIKYTLRAGNKASETIDTDLQKAAWYAARAAEAAKPQKDPGTIKHLADLFDEESYRQGMHDAAGSPSLALRAVIYALQESGFEERFVAESDLNVAPTRALEIERIEANGIPGFMVKVIELALPSFENAVVQTETPGHAPVSDFIVSDPGDEVEHVHHEGLTASVPSALL